MVRSTRYIELLTLFSVHPISYASLVPHARIHFFIGTTLHLSLSRYAGLYVSRGYSNDSESSSTRDSISDPTARFWTIGPSYWCL